MVRCAGCARRRPHVKPPIVAEMVRNGLQYDCGWQVLAVLRRGRRGAGLTGVVGEWQASDRLDRQSLSAIPAAPFARVPPDQTGKVVCRVCRRRLPVGRYQLAREAEKATISGAADFLA